MEEIYCLTFQARLVLTNNFKDCHQKDVLKYKGLNAGKVQCGGVRLHLHLNMDKPTGSNPANIKFIMQKENITKYQPKKQFTLLLLNSQSLKPKEITVHHHLESENVDALVITETWLSDKDADKVWINSSDLNKNGLTLLTSNRKSK